MREQFYVRERELSDGSKVFDVMVKTASGGRFVLFNAADETEAENMMMDLVSVMHAYA